MQYKNTEIIIAIVAATILFVLLAGYIIGFLFFYNKKKRLYFKEIKEQRKLLKEEAFRSEMEIREQTLRHISEEIHDNVGQLMLLSKLNLSKFLMATPNKAIEETRDIIGEAINDLRDISKSIHSEQITSLDFCQAIEKELDRLKKTGLLETSLTVEGEITKIQSSKKLILIRMIQEILQNILKHSKGSKVTIHLNYEKEFLYLNIEDNGNGFIVKDKMNSGIQKDGSGLLNLQNRATALRAQLSIKSQPYEGTCINIKMPLLL